MFVTDTHPIVHYALRKHSKLGQKALQLFKDAEAAKTVIHVPTVVLWEIADLLTAGIIKLPTRFDHWYRELDGKQGFILEPLAAGDVNEARHLPFQDPFDCLVAGTALRLGYPLITKDRAISDSGLLETIW